MTPSGLLFAILSLTIVAAPALSGYPDLSYGPTLPAAGVSYNAAPFFGAAPYRGKTAILKAQAAPQRNPLQEIFSWNALEYNLPAYPHYEIDAYNPLGSIFTGLEFTSDKFFIAIPRLYPGVPATLAYIPRAAAGIVQNPKLEPFPSAEWTSPVGEDGELANCSKLISVYRIKVDKCNRLWVVDAGVVNSETPVCTPKLIAFDVTTGQPVRSFLFPKSVLKTGTLFTNIILDEEDPSTDPHCERIVFYFNDDHSPAIVVYDLGQDRIRRISDLSMYADPDNGFYSIAGETFTLMDGIIGMALSPSHNLGGRILYYQPMSQNNIYSVPTSALRDFSAGDDQELPVKLVGTKSSQGIGLTIDNEGTLYFSPLREIAVGSYNTQTGKHRTIVVDTERLQSVTDLRIDEEDGSLYLLSTRFQKYVKETVSLNEINMRMLRIPREDLYPGAVHALGVYPQAVGSFANFQIPSSNFHNVFKRSSNTTSDSL